jgi:hypothetical protein
MPAWSEYVHLCFVVITAARLVEQQSAVIPAIPQVFDHVDELG